MTAGEFRKLALSMPQALESQHMDHPDFRVRGKIFASLGPQEEWGMVKLTPAEQAWYVRTAPEAFRPAAGAWGRGGSTIVQLERADNLLVRQALAAA